MEQDDRRALAATDVAQDRAVHLRHRRGEPRRGLRVALRLDMGEREAPTQQEEQDDRAQITKPLHHAPHCSSP